MAKDITDTDIDMLNKREQMFVLRHIGLINKTARDYVRKRTCSFDDAKQIASFGVMAASKNYDENNGAAESTYVKYWIDAYLMRYVDRVEQDIYNSTHLVALRTFVKKFANKFFAENNREPTYEEKLSAINEKYYKKYKEHTIKIVLNNSTVINSSQIRNYIDEQEEDFVENCLDKKQKTPEDFVLSNENREILFDAMECLSYREQEILIRRYGLNDDTPESFDQMKKYFGVSKERLRVISIKALKKLKGKLESKI